jgi:hypothetical protein
MSISSIHADIYSMHCDIGSIHVAYIGCDLHRLHTSALRRRSQRFLRAGALPDSEPSGAADVGLRTAFR